MDMTKKDKSIVFVLGGLLAAVSFVCIFGFRVLIPTYDDWLLFSRDGVDNMQHYQGWVAYRRSPWQFPIGLIEGILYPDRISVIYTDSVPLFAIFFKLLSPVLPETFQYFGIFGLICAFLLGAFASLFIYRFTEHRVYSVLCALFFSTAFVFLHRMFYHTALSAQWIVVASLYLWLACGYRDEKYDIKRVACWSVLSVVALLTEAYFLPMVWGIMVCDLIGFGFYKESFFEFVSSAVKCVLPMAALTVLTGWVSGLFYGDVDSTGLGLGVYTFNLINFINPFWMSSVIPWLPSDFFQYEGLAYLGLGIFLLIAVILILWICKKLRGEEQESSTLDRSKYIPLVVFFFGFIIAAVSPTISLGDYRMTLPLPEFVLSLWSTFRSSGRLIWPVYYLIILSVCIGVKKLIKNPRAAVAILCFAFFIQLYDAHGFIGGLHDKFFVRQTYISGLSDPMWEEIGRDYEHIMVCPDVHAIYYTYEGEELEHFALQNGMTMNIVYTARVVSDRVNDAAEETLDRIRTGIDEPDKNTVYVFLDGKRDDELKLKYYDIDGYTIGIAK